MPNNTLGYVGFDTETTGLDLEEARIIQAAVVGDKEKVTFINPGIEIPADAVAIHGITNEFVANNGLLPKDGILEIWKQLTDQNKAIVGCNLQFDLTIFDRECRRYGIPPINFNSRLIYDVLVLDRGLDKYRRGSRKLTALAEHYGVPRDKAHDALGDVKMTIGVLEKMKEKFPEIDSWSPAELMAMQQKFHKDWAINYINWCRNNGREGVVINLDFPYVPLYKEVNFNNNQQETDHAQLLFRTLEIR